jgi:hypothetical protein
VLKLVEWNFPNAKPGYRNGVVLVPVPTTYKEQPAFYSNIVQLKEGDVLAGEFKPRHPGEKPRKSTYVVGGQKMPAKSVEIVLYHKDVLAEGNERSSDADWEIISINASPFEEGMEIPMSPGTLMSNHFQLSGGTATHMTDSDFVNALRKSVLFWKDKANAAPK